MKVSIRFLHDWFRLVQSPRARPYLALTFCVDACLVFVFLVAIQSYLPQQYDGGSALSGYALAAYGAAKLAAQLLGGRLIDRLGARRGIFLSLAIVALGQLTLLAAIADSRAVIPAAAVYGLGGATFWPALYALAGAEFSAGERARLTSGMTVATGLGLGTALGLGFLLPQDFPYAAAIAMTVAAVLLALLAVRSLPAIATPVPAAVASTGPWPRRLAAVVREILHTHRLGLSLVVLLQAAALGGLLAVFRSYGRDVLDVSFRQELLLMVPAGGLAAIAVIAGGALSDRVGRIPLLGAGSIIAGLSVWMLSIATQPFEALPFFALAALGLALMMPSVSALCMDLSRTASAATLLAWFLTMEGIGHATGPAAGAWLSGQAGTTAALWLVGGIFLAISVVTLVPPIWATLPFNPRAAARRMNRLLAFGLKGSLVAGIALPVLTTYWAMSPSSQIYGHLITHGPRDRMEVALTFDDGPSSPWTERIAGTLDSLGVKGTFFMVGANVDRHPEIARRLAADGQLIGNHSYRHRKHDTLLDVNYGDLDKAETAIARATGRCPAFYRPPNGFHTPWQLRAVKHHHMHAVTWDVIPKDWKDPPADVIVERVLRSVHPGSIVLLHDGYNTTDGTSRSVLLEALPRIVQGLQDKGYTIVRLDQLLSMEPYLPTCAGLEG